jgi:ABC-type branched-subunit amino acid transport system substrate-binding protein
VFDSRFEKTFLIAIALLAAAACGRSRRVYVARAAEPEAFVVRIGDCASLTGSATAAGTAEHRGFEFAIEEWNASEHARRLRAVLVTYDDQSRPAGAAAAVQRLITDDHVDVVAAGSDAQRAAANAGGALVICPSCPFEAGANVIGLAPSLSERADLLADLVVRTMNMNKIAILVRRDVASDRAAAEAFRASAKSRHVVIGEALAFTPESITGVLAQLVADAPHAVLVAFDGTEAALVGRALRRRAVPSALLFFGTPNIRVLPEADRLAALEGGLFPSLLEAARADETGRRFLEQFEARHATTPDERAFQGYAAGRRVLDALLAASSKKAPDARTALLAARPSALAVVRIEHGTFVRLLPTQN